MKTFFNVKCCFINSVRFTLFSYVVITSFITSFSHKKLYRETFFFFSWLSSQKISITRTRVEESKRKFFFEAFFMSPHVLTHGNAQRNHSKVVAFRLINELVSAFNYHNIIYSFHVILTLTHIMPYKRVHHSCLQLTSTMTNDIHYMKESKRAREEGGNEFEAMALSVLAEK